MGPFSVNCSVRGVISNPACVLKHLKVPIKEAIKSELINTTIFQYPSLPYTHLTMKVSHSFSLLVLVFFFSMNTNSFRKRLIRTEAQNAASFSATWSWKQRLRSTSACTGWSRMKPASQTSTELLISCTRQYFWLTLIRPFRAGGEQWEGSLLCFSFGAVYLYLPGKGISGEASIVLQISSDVWNLWLHCAKHSHTGDQLFKVCSYLLIPSRISGENAV